MNQTGLRVGWDSPIPSHPIPWDVFKPVVSHGMGWDAKMLTIVPSHGTKNFAVPSHCPMGQTSLTKSYFFEEQYMF